MGNLEPLLEKSLRISYKNSVNVPKDIPEETLIGILEGITKKNSWENFPGKSWKHLWEKLLHRNGRDAIQEDFPVNNQKRNSIVVKHEFKII